MKPKVSLVSKVWCIHTVEYDELEVQAPGLGPLDTIDNSLSGYRSDSGGSKCHDQRLTESTGEEPHQEPIDDEPTTDYHELSAADDLMSVQEGHDSARTQSGRHHGRLRGRSSGGPADLRAIVQDKAIAKVLQRHEAAHGEQQNGGRLGRGEEIAQPPRMRRCGCVPRTRS